MLVSDYFDLGVAQPSLDFVDVPVDEDVRLFVDPTALSLINSDWGLRCRILVDSFFTQVLDAIRQGNSSDATQLLADLREPNETRLGLSQGKPRGRGMNETLAARFYTVLIKNRLVLTLPLQDLEETALMVHGVADDIVSDITTNLIREPLIEYTQHACDAYGIPMRKRESGRLWDRETDAWCERLVDLPEAADLALLLVPKAIVRPCLTYNAGDYYNNFLLERLKKRADDPKVTKKSLRTQLGFGKNVIADLTLQDPEALEAYRTARRSQPRPSLTHLELAARKRGRSPDWESLLDAVREPKSAPVGASSYRSAIRDLLFALLWPSLTMPEILEEEGVRIDIRFLNQAQRGFFANLKDRCVATDVFVDCRNQSGQPGDSEIDELGSRFSDQRGQVGLLVRRQFLDKQRFIERCRAKGSSHHGYVIPLDDADLAEIVGAHKSDPTDTVAHEVVLRERFELLVE